MSKQGIITVTGECQPYLQPQLGAAESSRPWLWWPPWPCVTGHWRSTSRAGGSWSCSPCVPLCTSVLYHSAVPGTVEYRLTVLPAAVWRAPVSRVGRPGSCRVGSPPQGLFGAGVAMTSEHLSQAAGTHTWTRTHRHTHTVQWGPVTAGRRGWWVWNGACSAAFWAKRLFVISPCNTGGIYGSWLLMTRYFVEIMLKTRHWPVEERVPCRLSSCRLFWDAHAKNLKGGLNPRPLPLMDYL